MSFSLGEDRTMRNGILIVFAGLLVLCAARPKPKEHASRDRYPHFLSRLLSRNLNVQRRHADAYDCRNLATAVGNLLAYDWTKMGQCLPVPIHVLEDVAEMYLGFDVVNDHAALEEFYCHITPAESVANLKERLDDYDYNYNMVRAAYDTAIIFSIMDATENGTLPPEISLFNNLGFFSLDPEGVEQLREIVGLPAGNLPLVLPTNDDLDRKCAMLQMMAHNAVEHVPQADGAMFHSITGMNLNDTDGIDDLICDLVEAAPGGLSSIYDVLDERGIILHAYEHALYPAIQKYVRLYKPVIEMMVQMGGMNSGQGGMNPNSGGHYPSYGGHYPSHGGQYPSYGGQYPSYGGHYPSYGGQYPSYGGQYPSYGGPYADHRAKKRQRDYGGPGIGGPHGPAGSPCMPDIELMTLVLAFINEEEMSGLLSLQ